MFDAASLRKDFAIFRRKINGKPIVYLDNAATTQKPIYVLRKIVDFYSNHNANIHRSIHTLGEEATELFEEARRKVAKFINAKPEEIVFTKNTTESLNLVASSLGKVLSKDDEILTTIMEHHSNFVPWQRLAKEKGAKLRIADITDDGYLNLDDLEGKLTKRMKVIAMTHASNILGTVNPVERIVKLARENEAFVVVDGAQSVPHMRIDVKRMDIDFLAFSSHKMLGPMGVGVLYGRKDILETIEPFLTGGEMIKEVTIERTTWNELPYKFEAGTPNVADVVGFGEAIDYLEKLGMNNVRKHDLRLTRYALHRLKELDFVEVYGPSKADNRISVVSFNVRNVHSHDVAEILDREFAIAIRSGHGCAMPLMRRLRVSSVARASFYVYNDEKDIDILVEGLKRVKEVFHG